MVVANEDPLKAIRAQAKIGNVRVSDHAADEMLDESFSRADVLAGIASGVIITVYEPKPPRWPTPGTRRSR